ncbi:cadherin-like and PC-esterase domain containing 1 [Chamberlinius hualienensis]
MFPRMMRIIFNLRCRSFRDLLVFLLTFSLLSLYLTYHLGSLSVSSNGSRGVYFMGGQIPPAIGNHALINEKTPTSSTKRENKVEALHRKLQELLVQIENGHLSVLQRNKVALVHGQQRIVSRDLPLYQDLLLRHQFTVRVLSSLPHGFSLGRNGSFISENNGVPKHGSKESEVSISWWVLFCMTSLDGDESCLPDHFYPNLETHQKINRILGIRNLLWSVEGLCNTLNEARQISVLRRRYLSPICFQLPEQYEQFLSVADALGEDSKWIVKHPNSNSPPELLPTIDQKVQTFLKQYDSLHPVIVQQLFPNPLLIFGSPLSVRVYVLVTSVLPLRAHLFNEGLVHFRYDTPAGFKKVKGGVWMLSQLWHHIATNYGQQMVETAIINLQNTLVQTLLFTEMKIAQHLASLSSNRSKIHYRCQHCFQLLSFEVIFNSSFHPIIVEVDGHPSMEESSKQDGWTGDRLRHILLNSVMELLFSTESVAQDVSDALRHQLETVGVMGVDCQLSHSLCLTNDDLRYLLDTRRESKNRGGFRQLYPAIGMEQLNSLLMELDGVIHSKKLSAISMDDYLSRLASRHNTVDVHHVLAYLENFYSSQLDGHGKVPLNTWSDASDRVSSVDSELFLGIGESEKELKPSLDGHTKCSEDPSTLPYIKSIYTEPSLTLNPPFSPAVMEYFVNVSYDQLLVKVWASALNCQCEVRLEEKFGISQPTNYTLGLGDNHVTFVVVDIRHTEPWVINTYTLTIRRQDVSHSEPNFDVQSPHEVCSIRQECDFQMVPSEPCGLHKDHFDNWLHFSQITSRLPLCSSGDAHGRWILPCQSCSNRESCYWRHAQWSPVSCRYDYVSGENLSKCLAGKKILFIGDSTNRGIMHYLMERLNGSLTEWDKTHHLKVYNNVNGGRTSVSFAYYPQFWLPTNERPVFEKAFYQLLQRSRPLENNFQTILIVGGVHWLATQHLHLLLRVLKREGLEGIRLMMKTLGSGFHLPVDGVHRLSKTEQRKLLLHSMGLAEFAKHYNFEVIDTFNVTVPRYKDFLQGKCACHFHRVVPVDLSIENITAYLTGPDPSWRFQVQGQSASLPWILRQKFSSGNKGVRFHVEGPVNAAYSEILISRLCSAESGT